MEKHMATVLHKPAEKKQNLTRYLLKMIENPKQANL